MDPEVLKFIISISGAIILILMASIGFFFKQLYSIVMELKNIVSDLKGIVGSQRSELISMKEHNEKDHKIMSTRLNSHAVRLDQHAIKLAKLEK